MAFLVREFIVYEPVLEDCLGHFLEGCVHLLVKLDLFVQRTEDMSDGTLFRQGRHRKSEVRNVGALQAVENRAHVDELPDLSPPIGSAHNPAKKRLEDCFSIRPDPSQAMTHCTLTAWRHKCS